VGGQGANAPLAAQMRAEMAPLPLIRLPLLSEQFKKLETFNLYKFVFCYCSSVLQSFAQGLF